VRRPLASLLVALALCLPALAPGGAAAAAPIHPTVKQAVALNALTGYVQRLVALTRSIDQGVEVPERQIVALRAQFARWNTSTRALFGARLAPVVALGRQGVVVLNAVEQVETVGSAASKQRARTAVLAFNARVLAFSRLPFA
jgi:phage-related tail protein